MTRKLTNAFSDSSRLLNSSASRRRFLKHATSASAALAFSGLPRSAFAQTAADISPSAKFFPGFKPFKIKTSTEIAITDVIGGSGPPVLLLHGAPVNFASWG